MANVEEARYDVLMSADGKELVQARYAVRNNQRNFVKITLPAGATVWSASLGGKPIRPGQSPDGSLLLPLEKSRGGEDAPAFVVEILYLTKATTWEDKGRETVTLPAVDLPISRTGMLLYYPPLFKVTAEPGTFRLQQYENPVSAALHQRRQSHRHRCFIHDLHFHNPSQPIDWSSLLSFRTTTTKRRKTQRRRCWTLSRRSPWEEK